MSKTWKRKIEEYVGEAPCDYCLTNVAKFRFTSGKLCCKSTASNCPSIRISSNRKIYANLTTEAKVARALKGAQTKRTTLDSDGNSIFDLYGQKMKTYIASTLDENGRTKWSRVKLSDEDFEKLPEYRRYRDEVSKTTSESFSQHFSKIKNSHLRGNDYHLDHVYSVIEGFRNGIQPDIIGNFTNLQVIAASDNCSKGSRCDKTKEQLIEDYTKWLTILQNCDINTSCSSGRP